MAGRIPSRNLNLVFLPAEVRLGIMSHLPSIPDLVQLALCCKQLYKDVHEAANLVAYDMLNLELGTPVLAMAVACYAASTAPWKCARDPDAPIITGGPEYQQHVEDFCNKYLSKSGTEILLPKHEFTFPMAVSIYKFHRTVSYCAVYHASQRSWGYKRDTPDDRRSATPSELARFERTFYLIEIISHLFVWSPVPQRQEKGWPGLLEAVDHVYIKFWLRFAPWEAHRMQAVEMDMEYCLATCYVGLHRTYDAISYYSRCNWIRMVMWMGIEKAYQMIWNDQFTPQQNDELDLLVSDPRFQRVRCQFFLDPGCWFTRDFDSDLRHYNDVPVSIDLKVLDRYDKHSHPDEKRGDLWLVHIKKMTWHHPLRPDLGDIYDDMQRMKGIWWNQLWWDRVRCTGPRLTRPVKESWEQIRDQPVGFISHYAYGRYYDRDNEYHDDDYEYHSNDGENYSDDDESHSVSS